MLRHLLLYVRDVKSYRPALFRRGVESVCCGLWEGLRQITNIFDLERCFMVKTDVSTEIRPGNFPYRVKWKMSAVLLVE
jgi:hypothetical protein